MVQGHVEHHIAHFFNLGIGHALATQVGAGGGSGREQPARDAVRQDAVDLFGHGHVEAAQTRLNVRHRNVQFGRSQRTGQGGVGVAIDQHGVGFFGQQDFFNLFEHAARHGPMPAAMNVQKVVGLVHAQLVKEDIGHVGVKVLAGVHKHFLQLARLAHGVRNHAGLDELWACA